MRVSMDERQRVFWSRNFCVFFFRSFLLLFVTYAYNEVCTVYFYNLQFGWQCRVLAPLIVHCIERVLCCALLCRTAFGVRACVCGLFLAMFGFTMSSVRLILSVNGCKSIQKLLISYVLVCVSKWRCLNCICIVRVQSSSSLILPQSLCVCIVSIFFYGSAFGCFNMCMPNIISVQLVAIFLRAHNHCAHIKIPL